ncbi:zinc finger protein 70-like [Belonocnema kinseyi]|uniref:zinc finger protein 70-like n=1 Tax=Belonocnema kinseyi TaxID=2817044 RepID=UPI00143D4A0C|nr:zinc finger protein 70-like [Belonocnema kinseyi]
MIFLKTLDYQMKSESKKSTGRRDGGPYVRTTTDVPFDNKFGAMTSIEYAIDESLDIKEENVQDPGTSIVQKRNETYKSKFYTVNIREGDICYSNPKVQSPRKLEIQKSKLGIKYTCNICARSYARNSSLTAHKKFECGVMPQFSCKFCGQLFKRKSHMNEHIDQVHHKISSTKPVLMHKCDKCSRSYIWPTHLARHRRLVHAAVKPQFICDFCGYKTNTKCNLVTHMNSRHSQTTESKHICNICARNYRSASGLYQHKRIEHAVLKPQFNCAICEFKTKRKDYLSNHITAKHFHI